MVLYYIIILLFGLIFGSFLTSFSYRILKGEILPKGRSYCPKCKKQIAWYDNIPLLSYLVLGGKCRNCGKHISIRYPLIEIATGILFVFISYQLNSDGLALQGLELQGWALPFYLLVTVILVAVFITDWEHQLIPDELSFALIVVSFLAVLFTAFDAWYIHMLSGFGAALFLLLLHLFTLGRGMGLGDVKLAIGIGFILGWPYTLTWLFTSFILGAIIGVALLSLGHAKFGRHIAFGPFLILAFFVVLLWGDTVTGVLMPYL
jgi:prepilin signal peptidase PulO-like enzyme (type II secretory pathway)